MGFHSVFRQKQISSQIVPTTTMTYKTEKPQTICNRPHSTILKLHFTSKTCIQSEGPSMYYVKLHMSAVFAHWQLASYLTHVHLQFYCPQDCYLLRPFVVRSQWLFLPASCALLVAQPSPPSPANYQPFVQECSPCEA